VFCAANRFVPAAAKSPRYANRQCRVEIKRKLERRRAQESSRRETPLVSSGMPRGTPDAVRFPGEPTCRSGCGRFLDSLDSDPVHILRMCLHRLWNVEKNQGLV
jgi:hypothetical protein